MSYLNKVAIIGSPQFNNYYLLYIYLKEYVSPDTIIVLGNTSNITSLVKIYADINNQIIEEHLPNTEKYGDKALAISNRSLLYGANHVIAFWDNKSEDTKQLIDMFSTTRNIKPTIIDVSENDIIKPHPGRVVNINKDKCDVYCGCTSSNDSISFGNPFPLNKSMGRGVSICMFIDYFLKHPLLIEKVLNELPGKVLGCYCAPKVCHCDAYLWMLDNVSADLRKIVIESKLEKTKEVKVSYKSPQELWELTIADWPENSYREGIYTPAKTKIAEGFETIVQDKYYCYLEIKDKDIVKNNIHLPVEESNKIDNSTNIPIKVNYSSNDSCQIPIMFYNIEFDGTPFKTGYWYIRTDKVTKR